MEKCPFIHLHNHSHYSLLSALPKIKELVGKAKEFNMPALALTDNGNLYGAIEFYKSCEKNEIKPILGMDAYVAIRTRHDKESGIDNRRYRLTLLAKNAGGFKNLIKLSSIGFLEGFYYKPRVDHELLEKYNKNLIVILPIFSGEISDAIKFKDLEKADRLLEWHIKTFGQENLYFEITHHPEISGHEKLVKDIVDFAEKNKIEILATGDSYYLAKNDKQARETLIAVNSHGDRSERVNDEADFSFVQPEQMVKWFKEYPEAIANSLKIADQINIELRLGDWVFPDYKIEDGGNADDALKNLAYKGLEERKVEKTPEVMKRLDYELEVIKTKGYSPYFLIVSDLLRHAKGAGILSTTRGSAGGSFVSFLTYITTINPLVYDLPFERFLNPDRPSAPDIDMDIADNKRDKMIDYAKEKYGEDKVAQIGTFGTMMARGSVRDTARALGFPYEIGDKIAKLIPMGSQGFPMTIDHAMEITPDLKEMYKKENDVKTIIDTAKKIEGCARHVSVHAAGVVISPVPITDMVPVQLDPKGGKLITQYDMHAVEDAGLIKFDFLGIKNLAILANAVKITEKLENQKIDLDHLPLDDKKTFEMLARGETVGVFQLSGSGMTSWLKELQPNRIEDIMVMIALYRPGPMANIPEYIARKSGKSKITYLHPKMANYLEKSYGIMVYQEDIMFTALELAGYTWLTVDKLRKAIGKKIPEEMAKQHEIFIKGCKESSGIDENLAEKIWELFVPFQGYGFNKAHAASYGMVAYQTAYMKANFPAIYMSAVLTADSGDTEKIGETVAECKKMNIDILPPSVNESFSDFTVIKKDGEKDKIRFGLTTIKNFGEGISDSIIAERKSGGPFKSLGDFLLRVKDRNLNKKSLEALMKSGALDEFADRGVMLGNMEKILNFLKERGSGPKNQDSLFAGADIGVEDFKLDDAPMAPEKEKLAWEKELLGLYLSGHPLDKYKEVLSKREVNIKKVKLSGKEGMTVVIAGIIEEFRPIVSKKGDQMAFIKLADFSDGIEVVIFPRTFTEFKNLLEAEKCIAIKGKVSKRNGETSLIADKIKLLV